MLQIERVTPEQDAGVQSVLAASRLMGLDTGDSDTLALALSDEVHGVAGCAAVERYGDNGLLRSVAVLPELRGRSLGQYLVAAAEAEAREEGIARLYLLTETAERFFARLGYEVVPRAEVPEAVLASDQFAKLCPSTAVAMMRRLNEQD